MKYLWGKYAAAERCKTIYAKKPQCNVFKITLVLFIACWSTDIAFGHTVIFQKNVFMRWDTSCI